MPFESPIDRMDDPSFYLKDRFGMFRLADQPEPGSLADDEVHLFYSDVDSLLGCACILEETLSDSENFKKDRFLFGKDRSNYIVSRGLLRVILGAYLGEDPKKLVFINGPQGKPMLDGGSDHASLRFSVSHSNRLVLHAISRGRELGVDIEKIRPELSFEEISEKYFSAREAAFLRTRPVQDRIDLFFTYWTLKEAFMKVTGKGFSLPLNRFEITHDPPKVLSLEGDSEAAARWSLRSMHLEPGYASALAVEGPDLPIRYWKLAGRGRYPCRTPLSTWKCGKRPVPCGRRFSVTPS